MAELSHTQIDRLGDRLRRTSPSNSDLDAYADFRDSHQPALATVIQKLHELVPELPVTARLKTPQATIEKLRRQTIRLSQIQDIAGCRLVLLGLREQDGAVAAITTALPDHELDDTREEPVHGYRSVHIIVIGSRQRRVEVQVRTEAQDLWAQLSEKFAETFGEEIKYGGGGDLTRAFLENMSARGRELDERIAEIQRSGIALTGKVTATGERQIQAELSSYRATCQGLIKSMRSRTDGSTSDELERE